MSEVLLDRDGTFPLPPGYIAIDNEVEFLRCATDDALLLIRGEDLCAWAYAFYTTRGRPCRYVESPRVLLRRAFPGLTEAQAESLAGKLEQPTALPDPLTAEYVLERCYPQDTALWFAATSLEHAARWLIWLSEHTPDEAEAVVLRAWAEARAQRAHGAPEAALYAVADSEAARETLFTWLGAGDAAPPPEWGEFPVELPLAVLGQVKTAWRARLIRTQGASLGEMLGVALPLKYKQALAESAADYFAANPSALTRERLTLLEHTRCLSTEALAKLRKHLSPPEPRFPSDTDERSVLAWFEREYLPYRLWQAQHGDDRARAVAREAAQRFARWYLERYPKWLLAREAGWIAFQRVSALAKDNVLTVCVVLDGLPAWDAEDLAQALSARIERLALLEQAYCFAPFPTVTEFAKTALLGGAPPRLAQERPPLAEVVGERGDIVARAKAQPRGLLFWKVAQPDEAYHLAAEHNRVPDIQGALDMVQRKIKELVEETPKDRLLQVVITTDHGRLCEPHAICDKPVPSRMHAHGRAAWGVSDRCFPAEGFELDLARGLCFVHGARFGLPEDVAIVWDDGVFQNGRGAAEAYPHGGLFPEEAIIPWFVFERDAQIPRPIVEVSGSGEAGAAGVLTVKLTNPTRLAVACVHLALSHDARACADVEWIVSPMSERVERVTLSPMPNSVFESAVTAKLRFRLPSGRMFTLEVKPRLELRALYARDESVLKDLEL